MNLDRGAGVAELRAMLAAADDAAGDHLLWVARTGAVYLAGPLAPGAVPGWRAEHAARLALVGAMFEAGGGRVGPRAARVRGYAEGLLAGLADAWARWTPPAARG
jgi:hypothetical protein